MEKPSIVSKSLEMNLAIPEGINRNQEPDDGEVDGDPHALEVMNDHHRDDDKQACAEQETDQERIVQSHTDLPAILRLTRGKNVVNTAFIYIDLVQFSREEEDK